MTESQPMGSIETIANGVRTETIVRFVLVGAGIGALAGIIISTVEYYLRGRGARDVSLTTYLIVYPVVGAILGWSKNSNPTALRWKRPAGFFATEPLSADERDRRGRRVRKSAWTGFFAGIAAALSVSALDVAWRGWIFLSAMLGGSLLFGPIVGAFLGFNLGLRPGDPKPSCRNIRFGMRTLMVLTAYLGCWLAIVIRTTDVSKAAGNYLAKLQSARENCTAFQRYLDESIKEAERSKIADELRARRIPDGLSPSQKQFLKMLDRTASPQYRNEQYDLIADGEQRQADLAAENVRFWRGVVDSNNALAEKYAKAAREPWLPVEPDPGEPPGLGFGPTYIGR